MSDHAKFLAAVIAAPDDDLPRLIFADWLDEHGEPERAEFIRVQCELAKWRQGAAEDSLSSDGISRHATLRRRERELWAAIDLSELPGHTHARSVESWVSTSVARFDFRRGFAAGMSCTWTDWLAHSHAMLAACPIRNAKDGLVRLTTWPSYEMRMGDGAARLEGCETFHPVSKLVIRGDYGEFTLSLLAAEFPGVEFELPAEEDDVADLLSGTLQELGRMRFEDIAAGVRQHADTLRLLRGRPESP